MPLHLYIRAPTINYFQLITLDIIFLINGSVVRSLKCQKMGENDNQCFPKLNVKSIVLFSVIEE